MDKKGLFGINTAILIIAVALMIVGVWTISKWEVTGNVVDKIEKMAGDNMGETVLIKTSMGDIIVELNSKDAPITTENFLSYVDSEFYDNLIFHRVMDGFMVQGGGFDISGKQKETHAPIKLESNNGLKNSKYTIAMARTNVPDSATSQFFINVEDNYPLDYSINNPGYAVFGKVINGEEVVDKIKKVETSTRNGQANWPVDDVLIYSIRRM